MGNISKKILLIIYEVLYAFFFIGIVFSLRSLTNGKSTPVITLILFATLLISIGFSLPFLFKKYSIKANYVLLSFCSILFCYVIFSRGYYKKELAPVNFHPFLQGHIVNYDNVTIPKPKNIFRIVTLGGSTTEFGYPPFLEEKLNANNKNNNIKFEIINAGVSWYTSQHSIINYLFRLKDFDPDLVIFQHAINDITHSLSTPGLAREPYEVDYSHYYGPISRLWHHDTFERYVFKKLKSIFYADLLSQKLVPKDIIFQSEPSFNRNLQSLISILKSENTCLIVTTQPHSFREDGNEELVDFLLFPKYHKIDEKYCASHKSWFLAMERFNSNIKNISKKNNVYLIDLAEKVKDISYFSDGVHLKDSGSILSAEEIYSFILEKKLIGVCKKP